MATLRTKLTRKGQVTIPIAIRRRLSLVEGEYLDVELRGDVILLRRTTSVAESTAGILAKYRKDPPLTPEEERAAFEQGVADEVTASLEG